MLTKQTHILLAVLWFTAACSNSNPTASECDSMQCLESAYRQCSAASFEVEGGSGGHATYRVVLDKTQSPFQCELSLTFHDNPNQQWNELPLFFKPDDSMDFETNIGHAVSECLTANPIAIRQYECSGPLLEAVRPVFGNSEDTDPRTDIAQWSCGRPVEETAALFPMVNEQRRWGFVDRSGEWKIRPDWDQVTPFSEGRAMVRDDEAWSLIDHSGRLVAEKLALAKRVGWSDELGGIAPIVEFSEGCAVFDDGQRLQMLDRSGQIWALKSHPPLLKQGTLTELSNFRHGLAAFKVNVRAGERQLTGYMDHQGTVAIEPQFAKAGSFGKTIGGDLLAPAADFKSADSPFPGQPGYIDSEGNWVAGMKQLYRAHPFIDGRALIRRDRSSDWHIWDGVDERSIIGEVDTIVSDLHGGVGMLTRRSFGQDLVAFDVEGNSVVALDNLNRCPRLISERFRHGLLALLIAADEASDCGDGNAGLHNFSYSQGQLVYLDRDGNILLRQQQAK